MKPRTSLSNGHHFTYATLKAHNQSQIKDNAVLHIQCKVAYLSRIFYSFRNPQHLYIYVARVLKSFHTHFIICH